MTQNGNSSNEILPHRAVPAPAAWAMMAIIFAASAVGQQLYAATPRLIFWSAAAAMAAVLLMLARRAPRGTMTFPIAALMAGAGLALAFAVVAGRLTPAELMHIPLFALLGAALHTRGSQGHAVCWLVGMSVGDEVLQALLPWRTGSVQDVVLNLASGLAGYAIAARWAAARRG